MARTYGIIIPSLRIPPTAAAVRVKFQKTANTSGASQ